MSRAQQNERAGTDASAGRGPEAADSERALEATQDALDKVRDILVGSQLRQHEARHDQLAEKLAVQFAEYQAAGRQQMERLEGFVKTELGAIAARLGSEVGQLSESIKRAQEEARGADRAMQEKLEQTAHGLAEEARSGWEKLSHELRAADAAMEARLSGSEAQQQAAGAEFRGQVFDQINAVSAQGQAQKTELLGLIEKMGAELRAAKPDRAMLAGMFSEMAGRLQG